VGCAGRGTRGILLADSRVETGVDRRKSSIPGIRPGSDGVPAPTSCRMPSHPARRPSPFFLFALPIPLAALVLGPVFGSTSDPEPPSDDNGEKMAIPTPAPEAENPFEAFPLELARETPFPLPGAASAPEVRPHPYSEQVRASFRLRVRDAVVPYRILAVTVRPGETLELELDQVWGEGSPEGFLLRTPDGVAPAVTPGRWEWTAPDTPGEAVPLRVESPLDLDAITLNVLILHPFEAVENGELNGFRIGTYRTTPDLPPPPGFVEAAPELLDLRVAPGFTLAQFLPKQEGNPRYLVLSEKLTLKMEAILEEVQVAGIEASTLYVMSGFRTPWYNRAIGNTTDHSRHLWGDAADFFIDETGNGRMDDLTGDGQGGEADARLLFRIVERVQELGEPHVVLGGLSSYRANAVRGPFLHVDTRGAPARW